MSTNENCVCVCARLLFFFLLLQFQVFLSFFTCRPISSQYNNNKVELELKRLKKEIATKTAISKDEETAVPKSSSSSSSSSSLSSAATVELADKKLDEVETLPAFDCKQTVSLFLSLSILPLSYISKFFLFFFFSFSKLKIQSAMSKSL
jgi:hypothetical protein